MTGSGIYEGDLLVVDKSLSPKNGDMVVGILEGEFILRVYSSIKMENTAVLQNSLYF